MQLKYESKSGINLQDDFKADFKFDSTKVFK